MPKSPSYHLYALVKSLSPSESRFYKLSIDKGDKEVLLLRMFEAIQRQKTFDDSALAKDLLNEFPLKSNFTVAKNHLAASILRVMRQYNMSSSSVGSQIRNYSKDIGFLIDKNLPEFAKKILTKAKLLAQAHQQYHYALELLVHENALIYLEHNAVDRATIRKRLEVESRELLELTGYVVQIESIVEEISILRQSSLPTPRKVDLLKGYLNSPAFDTNIWPKLLISEVVHLRLKQEIDYLIHPDRHKPEFQSNSFKESRDFLVRLEQSDLLPILQCHENIYSHFLYYFVSRALFTRTDIIRNLHEALGFYKRASYINESLNAVKNHFLYYYELRLAYFEKNEVQFLNAISSYNKLFETDEPILNPVIKVRIYYWLGVNYLMKGDFDNAEKYLNRVLKIEDKQEDSIREAIDFAYYVLILLYATPASFAKLNRHISKCMDYVIDTPKLNDVESMGSLLVNYGHHYEFMYREGDDFENIIAHETIVCDYAKKISDKNKWSGDFNFDFDIAQWFESEIYKNRFNNMINSDKINDL